MLIHSSYKKTDRTINGHATLGGSWLQWCAIIVLQMTKFPRGSFSALQHNLLETNNNDLDSKMFSHYNRVIIHPTHSHNILSYIISWKNLICENLETFPTATLQKHQEEINIVTFFEHKNYCAGIQNIINQYRHFQIIKREFDQAHKRISLHIYRITMEF